MRSACSHTCRTKHNRAWRMQTQRNSKAVQSEMKQRCHFRLFFMATERRHVTIGHQCVILDHRGLHLTGRWRRTRRRFEISVDQCVFDFWPYRDRIFCSKIRDVEYFHQIWSFHVLPFWTYNPEQDGKMNSTIAQWSPKREDRMMNEKQQ